MDEVWKPIFDFPEYAVSNHGRVMTISTERIKTASPNQQGIATVNLQREGRQNRRSLAPIVLREFGTPHPNSYFDTPIHLDGDRFNCHINNLAWRPRWFAVKYHQQFRSHPVTRRQTPRFIHIDTGREFDSYLEAARTFGLLEKDVILGLVNDTPVTPTYERFEYVDA